MGGKTGKGKGGGKDGGKGSEGEGEGEGETEQLPHWKDNPEAKAQIRAMVQDLGKMLGVPVSDILAEHLPKEEAEAKPPPGSLTEHQYWEQLRIARAHEHKLRNQVSRAKKEAEKAELQATKAKEKAEQAAIDHQEAEGKLEETRGTYFTKVSAVDRREEADAHDEEMRPADLDVEDLDGELAQAEEAINAERTAWIEKRKNSNRRKEVATQIHKEKMQIIAND